MSDKELLTEWVEKIRNGLIDERQSGGAPDLSKDGKKWRYSFMPKGIMSMEVEELQALFRYFGIEEIKPVEYGGNCTDCIHGYGVSSSTGIWPVIYDCEGCISPSHPYFIPFSELGLYWNIRKEDVFDIPCGGRIDVYFDRLRMGLEEGDWEYANTGGFCVRVSDGKRICKMTSLGKLDAPGNKR